MAADEETDDYIFYGTPLEREDELGRRKRKLAVEKGQARRLPPWQQEVTDTEGRRRFHGAFTGGFSAGYYNTVGSKEGWTPATFSSSRAKRADRKEQSALDYMDEDERDEINDKALGASSEFDTFGSTAAEIARRQSAQEIGQRASAIPGPAPDEIVVPVIQSIGVKLLLKMGWRQGRSIGPSHVAASQASQREARKAMMALAKADQPVKEVKVYGAEMPVALKSGSGSDTEPAAEQDETLVVPKSTPVFVLNPKTNKHGLGFDPFQNAPEFRDAKRFRMGQDDGKSSRKWGQSALPSGKPSLFRPNAGRMSGGFGIGALEDLGEEDEDVYAAAGFDYEIGPIEDDIGPSPSKGHVVRKTSQKSKEGLLPGFKLAISSSESNVNWFPPPQVPLGYVSVHKFTASLEIRHVLPTPEPPAVPPPESKEQCKVIEGLAAFVARIGQKFEDLSRERNMGNSLFGFLFGGPGHDYYVRKLWEERNKLADSGKEQMQKTSSASLPPVLGAEQRGKMLGEVALPSKPVSVTSMIAPEDRARLQSILMSTFTKSGSEGGDVKVAAKSFFLDPAKQARYEQYLKDKTRGGLRAMDVGGSRLSEVQRAQEILEFENAARGADQGSSSTKKSSTIVGNEIELLMGDRFTAGTVEIGGLALMHEDGLAATAGGQPRREEQSWRPSSLLCKRFDIPDPFVGKPPPLPKPRSRTESLILVGSRPDTEIPSESAGASMAVPIVPGDHHKRGESTSLGGPSATEVEEPPVDTIREKPVDLFKAIFSDSEEEEEEDGPRVQETYPSSTQGDDREAEKGHISAAEAAHSALNRLVAGDFLESLGKELGLKVPSPVERKTSIDGRNHSVHDRYVKESQPEATVGGQSSKMKDISHKPVHLFTQGGRSNDSVKVGPDHPDKDKTRVLSRDPSDLQSNMADAQVRKRSHSADGQEGEDSKSKKSRKHHKQRVDVARHSSSSDSDEHSHRKSREHKKQRRKSRTKDKDESASDDDRAKTSRHRRRRESHGQDSKRHSHSKGKGR